MSSAHEERRAKSLGAPSTRETKALARSAAIACPPQSGVDPGTQTNLTGSRP